MENREIERKWLASSLPNIKYDKVMDILNYYIYKTDNKTDNYDIRLRKTCTRNPFPAQQHEYFLTCKSSDSTINRIEIEEPITKSVYKILRQLPAKFVNKTRYFYGDWSFDVFKRYCMEGVILQDRLIIVEHEMKTEDAEVIIPKEIQKVLNVEVTGNKNYYNYYMSITQKDEKES